MKIRSLVLLLLFLLSWSAMNTELHADNGWMTDYAKALQQAHTEKKNILLDFTGSDWCFWCKKIQKDIFSQGSFQEFAKKNLILVEVDFPQAKEQSDVLKKQNADLQTEYGVEGFPTLILLDPNGKIIKRNTGYPHGGLEGLIEWIRKN